MQRFQLSLGVFFALTVFFCGCGSGSKGSDQDVAPSLDQTAPDNKEQRGGVDVPIPADLADLADLSDGALDTSELPELIGELADSIPEFKTPDLDELVLPDLDLFELEDLELPADLEEVIPEIQDTGVEVADVEPDVCAPHCDGAVCGADGCGGTCGECKSNWTCQSGSCFSPGAGVFSLILPGTFTMGPVPVETCIDPDEVPHQVVLTRAFYMKVTEVTQGEYEDVIWQSPFLYGNCGETCPAENVSWYDAVTYCNFLSNKDGLEPCYLIDGDVVTWPDGLDCEGYRLPTDAEWEFAVRAGTETAFYNGVQTDCQCGPDFGFPNTDYCACGEEPGLEEIAWFCTNSTVGWAGCYETTDDEGQVLDCQGPHPVGEKVPNPWGLYDASGNVWEWVWDIFNDDYDPYYALDQVDPLGPWYPGTMVNRAAKGGGFLSVSKYCRIANRLNISPFKAHGHVGFRIARTKK